eukprot:TRINITY_DN3320_c0_g2_i1.p1 TRINITY_DN3320_c0_g2~~TRINITY_DN3320_c0_g2_i1.p1  ORF type:complete len:679 (+),score=162.87 TRINITY_DN3320_c0_g2_i1:55-2091(+)
MGELTAYEELVTSPIEKIFKHHIIPGKFCFHLAIIICVSLFIAIPGTHDNVFLGKNFAAFQDFFIGSEFIEDIFEPENRDRSVELMSVESLLNFIEKVVDQYYHLESCTAQNYQFIRDEKTNVILNPKLTVVEYKSMELYSNSSVHYIADLEPYTHINYLNEQDHIGDWLKAAQNDHDHFSLFKYMLIEFSFKHFHDEPDFGYKRYDAVEVQWDLKFEFTSRLQTGIFFVTMNAINLMQPKNNRSFMELISWTIVLSTIMFFLSIVWLISIVRFIVKKFNVYYNTSSGGLISYAFADNNAKEIPLLAANPSNSDDELKESDSSDSFDFMHVAKLAYSGDFKIVDVWTIFDVLGAFSLFCFSITELISQLSFFFTSALINNSFTLRLFLLGTGSFCTACSTLQYFQFYPSLSYLVLTLTKGLPSMTKFLIGAMPLFYGYALFATAAFSPVAPRFENLSQSLVTQFCVLNGDDMLATFTAINQGGVVSARAYLYSYVIVFVWASIQIFIMIMEEAFCEATEELEVTPEDFQNDPEEELIQDLAEKNDVKKDSFEDIDNLIDEIKEHEQDQIEQLKRLKVLKLLALNRKNRVESIHEIKTPRKYKDLPVAPLPIQEWDEVRAPPILTEEQRALMMVELEEIKEKLVERIENEFDEHVFRSFLSQFGSSNSFTPKPFNSSLI